MASEAKLVVAVVLSLLLAVGATVATNYFLRLKAAAAQNEQRGRVLDTASGLVADGAKADAQQERIGSAVAQGRADFITNQREAIRNEPETASRASRTVPASVRAHYRERRRTRERLGCVEGECGSRNAAGVAAKR